MTAKHFLSDVVRPNLSEFSSRQNDLRFAFNAILAVDALAAHILYSGNVQIPPNERQPDSWYRNQLASRSKEFLLLRDVAKAQKHVRLTLHKPSVSSSSQVMTSPGAFAPDAFQVDAFQIEKVCVEKNDGTRVWLIDVLNGSVTFLSAEMERLGIPV
jgi:hypothetical protein